MDAPATSWRVTAAALPGALAIAALFQLSPGGQFVQRTWLAMPIHELGHAIAAWWCGYGAVPTLWRTLIPEDRGVMWLLVAALEAALFVVGWRRGWMALCGAAVALALVQLVGTTASPDTARAAITFAGDAGGMVLGALLMTGFHLPALARGGLRWGVLAIGAAAFVDPFATWWRARTDPDAIPFGIIEGVGLSDPAKLVEVHGWTERQLVERHLLVGGLALGAALAVTAWLAVRARREAA